MVLDARGCWLLPLFALLSCVCAASTPPRRGQIASCCGFGVQGYYWDGSACVPDTVCECDGRPADPRWRTLEECEAVHESCGE